MSAITLRDAAMCVTAYMLNGLRDSSVISLKVGNVEVTESEFRARLSVEKGTSASRSALLRYTRLSALSSPIDVVLRWKLLRWANVGGPPSGLFFSLQGSSGAFPNQELSRALERCLRHLSITSPPGGAYTSHSSRIGAHTEHVLLGIPLDSRLSRFGWGPNGQDVVPRHGASYKMRGYTRNTKCGNGCDNVL